MNLGTIPKQILAEMKQIPGLVDQDTTLNIGSPEVQLQLDRAKAADLGVRVQDVAGALRTMVAGEEVGKFKDGNDQYAVRLRLAHGSRPAREDRESLGSVRPFGPGPAVANFAGWRRILVRRRLNDRAASGR